MRESGHHRRMAIRHGRQPAAIAGDAPAGASRPGWRAGVFAFLRHPLFLLLISSLLISGVGRLYNDYSERVRDRAERREKLAPLIVELRYRALLVTREVKALAESAEEFYKKQDEKKQNESSDLESMFKDMEPIQAEFEKLQPKILTVLRGETGTSDPQFAKVHAAVIAYRIELLSGLPVQRFEEAARWAPPDLPRREVGIVSALTNLEQNLRFDLLDFDRAARVLAMFVEVRQENYADDILPVERGEAPPDATDYVKRVDEQLERERALRMSGP